MSKHKGELPPAPEPLPVPVVDAHTHLDACGATDSASVSTMVDRAERAGVSRVVTVSDDMVAARWAAEASTWDDRVFAAVALHPTRTASFTDEDKAELERLAAQPRVVAVGETGLDYYWDYAPQKAQHEAFRFKPYGQALRQCCHYRSPTSIRRTDCRLILPRSLRGN